MTGQSGDKVLLKVGDNGDPESFITVGGLMITNFAQRSPERDVTTNDSGGWQELLEGGGISSVSISGSGQFTDSAAEGILRGYSMNRNIRNYKIVFGNGDTLSGKFLITSYQRAGNYGSEESYAISMSSSGPVTYEAA